MRLLIGNIIGLVAGILGGSMSLPQAIRAFKKGTQGVSAATFQLFTVGTISWLFYGIHQHLAVSVMTNAALTIFNVSVLIFIVRDGSRIRDVTKFFLLFAPISIAIALINVTWLAWWGGCLSLMLRIPQAHRIRTSQDISGISLSTWVLGAFSNGLWALYGALLNDNRILVTCAAVSLMSASLSVAVIRKRRSISFLSSV